MKIVLSTIFIILLSVCSSKSKGFMMKNIIRFTVIFVCILFLCSHAHSQPSVSGTSGTFTHGGSVTISGSSFGANGDSFPAATSTMYNEDGYTCVTQ